VGHGCRSRRRESERLRHETGGDEGSTKDSAINGAVEHNTTVADNGVTGSITKCLPEVAVDHKLCLGRSPMVLTATSSLNLGWM